MQAPLRIGDDAVLEVLHADHAPALAELIEANRTQLGRWFPWVATSRSAADVGAHIASVASRHAGGTCDGYAIVVDGEVAGAIDLHDIDRERGEGRIGYWLAAPYQGRGVMTRAARGLAVQALRDGGLSRILIVAAIENAASRAVAERAGFTLVRIVPDGAQTGTGYADAAMYALTRDEVLATG